jgi:UDP-3-O-[3-hydroxymyristoyl] glucosamine N-acyltransferase
MIKAEELARLVGGVIDGDRDLEVTGVSSVEDAMPGDVVLAENPKYFECAAKSDATVIVCADGGSTDKTTIRVKNCRLAFARILDFFAPKRKQELGIAANCCIGESFTTGKDISVGYGCYVGEGVTLGDGVVIGPQSYVGDGVSIGAGSVLWPRVTVHWGTQIGKGVTVHSGTVIGADGFGYVWDGESHRKIPQIGRVVIEDDVEIGANVTIDRAKTGETRIGSGTKIDNLVMIAHNVRVGKNCIIVAQVGISGSTVIGDGVIMGGQSGVRDHVRIGDGAVVAARAGLTKDVPEGATMAGCPARQRAQYWRIEAAMERLPQLVKTVRELSEKIRLLERE